MEDKSFNGTSWARVRCYLFIGIFVGGIFLIGLLKAVIHIFVG